MFIQIANLKVLKLILRKIIIILTSRITVIQCLSRQGDQFKKNISNI